MRDQAIHCVYGPAGSMQGCGKSFTGKDNTGNIDIYFILTILYEDKKISSISFGQTRCSWGCPKISLKHRLSKILKNIYPQLLIVQCKNGFHGRILFNSIVSANMWIFNGSKVATR